MAPSQQSLIREVIRLDWIVYIAVSIFFIIEEVKVTRPVPFQVPFHVDDERYWAPYMTGEVSETTITLVGTASFVILVIIEFLLQATRLRDQAVLTGTPAEDTFVTAGFAALRLGFAGAITVLLAEGTCDLFREHVGELTPDFGYQCLGAAAQQWSHGNGTTITSDAGCMAPVLVGRQGFLSGHVTLAFAFAIFSGIHAVTRTPRICHLRGLPPFVGRVLYQLYLVYVMGAFLLAWGVAQNAVTHNKTFSFNTFGSMILATMVALAVFFAIDSAIQRDLENDYPQLAEDITAQEKTPFASS